MKVGELREKLSKLTKEEVVQIASEFYKLIPKAKKEDYDIDSLVNNPKSKRGAKKASTQLGLSTIEADVKLFIENAKEQNYLAPNRKVPKKERSKWRFKVKKWYKELTNLKRKDADIPVQAKTLTDLYELLCESCGFQYFTAYDTFESVGVTQSDFYKAVITLIHEAEGKRTSLEKCVKLIIDNYLNRYTLKSDLMIDLIGTLNIPMLREDCIDVAKKLLIKNNFVPEKKEKNRVSYFYGSAERDAYRKGENHNKLTELVFRLHASLHEIEEGIAFFKENHQKDRDEVKLYILVRLLFEQKKPQLIKREIELAKKDGTEPRKGLMDLLKTINDTGKLPQYM